MISVADLFDSVHHKFPMFPCLFMYQIEFGFTIIGKCLQNYTTILCLTLNR
jgi:hypothetical protein